MSFENFPYTNFHELNLDWIIQRVKEAYGPDNPPENIVFSVNGETGEVVLYKDAIVRLPDVEEATWNIHRVADNTSSGIEFVTGDCAKRIDGLNRYEMYDSGNPPPYPVRSVNGQTGNVTITIPVTSVNGQTGAITLYPNAVIAFPDVEASVWNMGRGSDGTLTGIQFIKDSPAQRMNGNSRYDIYDSGNPPPYPVTSVGTLTGAIAILDTTIVTDGGTQKLKITFPVTSVDGQTGVVSTWAYTNNDTLKTPIASSEANVWQLVREIPSGDAGIRFEYDSTDDEISGYLVFDDGVNTPLKLKILTPADIPSSSGVVSVNGLAGVVTLTGEDIEVSSQDSTKIDTALSALGAKTGADIPVSSQDSTKIDAALSALGTEDTNIKGSLAYNEDGNTATQNIPVGSFVVWKGHAYTASAAISSGDTLSTSTNLSAISDGIANELNSKLTKQSVSVTRNSTYISSWYVTAFSVGNILIVQGRFTLTGNVPVNGVLFTIGETISSQTEALLHQLNDKTYGIVANANGEVKTTEAVTNISDWCIVNFVCLL